MIDEKCLNALNDAYNASIILKFLWVPKILKIMLA